MFRTDSKVQVVEMKTDYAMDEMQKSKYGVLIIRSVIFLTFSNWLVIPNVNITYVIKNV